VPISLTAQNTSLLIVRAAGPPSVQELIAKARANPGKLNYGAGIITTRLAGYLFSRLAGIDTVFIPYKGSAVFRDSGSSSSDRGLPRLGRKVTGLRPKVRSPWQTCREIRVCYWADLPCPVFHNLSLCESNSTSVGLTEATDVARQREKSANARSSLRVF
jgi:hypothetical protein